MPDRPGCVASGKTLKDITRVMAEAIELYLEGMRVRGELIPEPSTKVVISRCIWLNVVSA